MAPEGTSEATVQDVQEPVVETTQASPTPAPTAQEQTPSAQTAAAAAPEPDIEALLDHPRIKERLEAERRKAQSQKDREVQQARLDAQRQAQEQIRLMQEQARTAAMDNEEFGAYVRQRDEEQQKVAAYIAQRDQAYEQQRQQTIQNMLSAALALIKDEKAREAMRGRAAEFPEYPDFVEACAQAQRDVDVAREREKAAKAAREAATKDAAAKQAEQAVPDLGTGMPIDTGKKYPNTSHGRAQMLADGYAEDIARKKGG